MNGEVSIKQITELLGSLSNTGVLFSRPSCKKNFRETSGLPTRIRRPKSQCQNNFVIMKEGKRTYFNAMLSIFNFFFFISKIRAL